VNGERQKRTLPWPRFLALLLLAVGLLLSLAGWAIYNEARKAHLYTAGREAARVGHWGEAFASLQQLLDLDTRYRDAATLLAQVLEQAIAALPGSADVHTESELVRYLAATADPRLPAVLDRCAVLIPAGEFPMGSPAGRADEQPARLVYLDAFFLDRYEVTNAQYHRFLRAVGRPAPPHWPADTYPPGQPDLPVVGVSWQDANDYCAWAGKRLPTEAEWEKACRGEAGQTYPWGEVWNSTRANVDRSAERSQATPYASAWEEAWTALQVTPGPGARGLRPVGSYLTGASPYGILDLVGNASEWLADYYSWSGYGDLPLRNPVGMGPPWNRVVRGNSWYDPYGEAGRVADSSRCAARNSSHTAFDPRVGFRCARSLP
jgi:formylglycine-generating enzyme required for sulfatase activity